MRVARVLLWKEFRQNGGFLIAAYRYGVLDAMAVGFEHEVDVVFFQERHPTDLGGAGLLDAGISWLVEGGDLPFDAFPFQSGQ